MHDVEITVNAEVRTPEGLCGHSVCVLFDPVRRKLTHLVVREMESPRAQRMVPIDRVVEATPRLVNLNCTSDELRTMAPFVESEFILADAKLTWVRLWPFVEPAPGLIVLEHEKLPPAEPGLKRGVPVYADDGFIGSVGELMIEPASGKITHLVLRDGHLWGMKDISIPVSMIRSKGQGGIGLRLSKKEIERLPDIAVRRFGGQPRSSPEIS